MWLLSAGVQFPAWVARVIKNIVRCFKSLTQLLVQVGRNPKLHNSSVEHIYEETVFVSSRARRKPQEYVTEDLLCAPYLHFSQISIAIRGRLRNVARFGQNRHQHYKRKPFPYFASVWSSFFCFHIMEKDASIADPWHVVSLHTWHCRLARAFHQSIQKYLQWRFPGFYSPGLVLITRKAPHASLQNSDLLSFQDRFCWKPRHFSSLCTASWRPYWKEVKRRWVPFFTIWDDFSSWATTHPISDHWALFAAFKTVLRFLLQQTGKCWVSFIMMAVESVCR